MNKSKEINRVFLYTILARIVFEYLYTFLYLKGFDLFFGSATLQLAFSQVLFVLPALIYLLAKRDFKALRFKKIDIFTILLCILLYIASMPLLTLINLSTQLFTENKIVGVMGDISNQVPFIAGMIIIAVVPAFFEELTYRGLIYNTQRKEHPLGAIIVCGVMFGLMHGNINQFCYATVMGMFFALVVEATDSIWSTIVIHCSVNLVSTCLIYSLPKLFELLQSYYDEALAAGDTQTLDLLKQIAGTDDFSAEAIWDMSANVSKSDILLSVKAYIIPAIVGAIAAFFLFRLIAKRLGRWEHICGIFSRKRASSVVPEKISKGSIITWELIAGAVIMLAEMIISELLV